MTRTSTAVASPAATPAPHAPRPAPGAAAHPDALTGASFLQQEPALAKEAGLGARDMSGWAMGGASLSD